MVVGQDGEAMDHVQSHAEVERRLNTGVVILPLQDMVAEVAMDPARPVPHVTQIHVQVWNLVYLYIRIGYWCLTKFFNNLFKYYQ